MKTYTYQTENFKYTEVELKGKKRYFVEGFVSTIDPDSANEIVTDSAQKDIYNDIQENTITMDLEHEEWISEDGQVLEKPANNKVPVAKIVDSKLMTRGVWAKAEINSNSSRFQEIWGSIKDGFLHSFSIAFYPLKAVTREINGQAMRFIENLRLVNVTLTGSPVNTNATFNPVMKAVLKNMEASDMTEEPKQEQPKTEEPQQPAEPVPAPEAEPKPAEPVVDDKIDEAKKEIEELKKTLEEQKTVLETEKKELEDAKAAFETKKLEQEKVIDEKINSPLSNIKSLKSEIARLSSTVADLKAEMEAPVMKSTVEKDKLKNVVAEQSMLQMIK